MRNLKAYIICASVGIACLAGLICCERESRIASVRKSGTASYFADITANQNNRVEREEADRFSAFTEKHNGAYAYPKQGSGLFSNLEEALKYARANPNSNEIDNFIFRLDKKGEIEEIYNMKGVRTFPLK